MTTSREQSKPDPDFETRRAKILAEIYAYLLERRRRRLENQQNSTDEQREVHDEQ